MSWQGHPEVDSIETDVFSTLEVKTVKHTKDKSAACMRKSMVSYKRKEGMNNGNGTLQ